MLTGREIVVAATALLESYEVGVKKYLKDMTEIEFAGQVESLVVLRENLDVLAECWVMLDESLMKIEVKEIWYSSAFNNKKIIDIISVRFNLLNSLCIVEKSECSVILNLKSQWENFKLGNIRQYYDLPFAVFLALLNQLTGCELLGKTDEEVFQFAFGEILNDEKSFKDSLVHERMIKSLISKTIDPKIAITKISFEG
jgi:hypothetical protein